MTFVPLPRACQLSCLCVRFALTCAVVLGALLVAPPPARAFCRTTTVKAPSGYNPAVSGCWTEGSPLAWSVDRVPYSVASSASTQVSLTEATRVADLAFNAWNDALCDGESLGIQAYDDGPASVPEGSEGDALAAWASCPDSNSCGAAVHDVIVFDDDGWPYNDPANTLALTTVTYGVDDGRIFEAYTEINSAEHQLTTAEPPPTGSGAFDLQAILTHEAGHFLGLAHATDTSAIMYAYYQPGAIELTADDVDAICTVYPPQVAKAGCACTAASSAPATGGVVVGISLVAVATLRCRRRRRRASPRKSRSPPAPERD